MRIVFFDIDCLRPDHLGCYGYSRPTSPAIDSIAQEGVRFNNYYCSSSPCLPSRTAWSSGRFGIRNGVISNHGAGVRFYLRTKPYGGPEPDNEMFMRHLRTHKYDTVAFSNFADRHNALWFMYGWSEFHTPNLKGGDETAEEVNAIVLPWLNKNAQRDNIFIYINYWDVHRCYKMPLTWADRFKDFPVNLPWPDEKTIRAHQSINGPFTAWGQFQHNRSPFPLMPSNISSRKDFEHLITGYDTSIAYVDYHLNQVLQELDTQGVLDDTIIIISGDHGDAFGEHGIYSDHICADECIHHIPLIFKAPGLVKENRESSCLLYNTDFAPTFCDLFDLPTPEDWDGKSFKNILLGKPHHERDFLVWDHGLYAVQRAVRTKTHLMVRTYDTFGYPFEETELYDMTLDPYQTRNIRDTHPEVLQLCKRYLETWIQEQRQKGHCITDPLAEILNERGKSSLDVS